MSRVIKRRTEALVLELRVAGFVKELAAELEHHVACGDRTRATHTPPGLAPRGRDTAHASAAAIVALRRRLVRLALRLCLATFIATFIVTIIATTANRRLWREGE